MNSLRTMELCASSPAIQRVREHRHLVSMSLRGLHVRHPLCGGAAAERAEWSGDPQSGQRSPTLGANRLRRGTKTPGWRRVFEMEGSV